MLSLRIFLLFTVFNKVFCNLTTYKEFTMDGQSLSNCIISLLKQSIQDDDVVSFYVHTGKMASRTMSYIIQQVHGYDYLVVIKNDNHNLSLKRYSNYAEKKPMCYIIQAKEQKDLTFALKVLRSYKFWDAMTRFVIFVTTSTTTSNRSDLLAMIDLAMTFDIQYLLLIETPANEKGTHNFVTHRYASSYQLIDVCMHGKFSYNAVLFPSRVPTDLKGQELKIRVQINPPFVMRPESKLGHNRYNFTAGMEVFLLNTLSALMNFTPIYSLEKDYDMHGIPSLKLNDGEISADAENGTGIFEPLARGEVDMVMSALKMTPSRLMVLDRLADFYNSGYVFCASAPRKLKVWEKIARILSPIIYMSILLIGSLIGILIKSNANMNQDELARFRSLKVNLLLVYTIFVSGSAGVVLPRTSASRFTTAVWTIFCLIISISFTSHLYRALTSDGSFPRFTRALEAFETDFKFYLTNATYSMFLQSANRDDQYIAQKGFICPDEYLFNCIMDMVYNGSVIMSTPKYYRWIIENEYVDDANNPLVYCFKDDIEVWSTHQYVKRGFWLQPRLNRIMHWFREFGFQEMLTTASFDRVQKRVDAPEKVEKTFNIEHFVAGFTVLGVGCIVGTICFWIEVFRSNNPPSSANKSPVNVQAQTS